MEQLAKAYGDDPAIGQLADILELPANMGLALQGGGADALKRFLIAGDASPTPALTTGDANPTPTNRQRRPGRTGGAFGKIIAKARSEVEQGRIGTAWLTSQEARPTVDREVIELLRQKHPHRPRRARYVYNRIPMANVPSAESIKKAIQDLPRDTAVGLSN